MDSKRLESLSTGHLEELAKHPRDGEEARMIREELKRRGSGLRDTGTLSLFGASATADPSGSGAAGGEGESEE